MPDIYFINIEDGCILKEVYLGIGSNIGNRKQFLSNAVQLLSSEKNILIKRISSIFETKPVGPVKQRDFLNAVVLIETDLDPSLLFNITSRIENELNRKRDIKWGSRTIDIDILLYGEEIFESDNLIIPHKELFNRAFVIIPLLEILHNQIVFQNDLKKSLNGLDTSSVVYHSKFSFSKNIFYLKEKK